MDKTKLFQMRTDGDFLVRLDDWRRHQPDIPSRAEAVRRLTAAGLRFSDLFAHFGALRDLMDTVYTSGRLTDTERRAFWRVCVQAANLASQLTPDDTEIEDESGN
ncbi:MAG: hypothetical protein WCO00_16860 [Rhodospirillaceae bacterium]